MSPVTVAGLRALDEARRAEQFEAFHAMRTALARRDELTISKTSTTEEKGDR